MSTIADILTPYLSLGPYICRIKCPESKNKVTHLWSKYGKNPVTETVRRIRVLSNEPIKDERKETRKADGSTRDKASFETEDYKYDWDLYTDKIGDQRGSVGAGIKKEKNELYGKIDFNEKQVAKDSLFSNEYDVNDNLSLRGEISGDNKGKLAGGVGARLGNELGYVDAELKANAKSELKGINVAGRYDVTDNTTVRARYSA